MPKKAQPLTTRGSVGALSAPRKVVAKRTRAPTLHVEIAKKEPVRTIIAHWQRERPDLDFEPMALFAALTRAYLLSSSQIDKLMAGRGVTRGMFDVLATLRRAGSPYRLTPKELSASLLLSGAGMTNRLDGIEALGLVARLPEPTDRRSLQIQLTKKGKSFVDETLPDLIEAQRTAFGIGVERGRKLMKLLILMNDRLMRSQEDSSSLLTDD